MSLTKIVKLLPVSLDLPLVSPYLTKGKMVKTLNNSAILAGLKGDSSSLFMQYQVGALKGWVIEPTAGSRSYPCLPLNAGFQLGPLLETRLEYLHMVLPCDC